jgi:hypothetical protein
MLDPAPGLSIKGNDRQCQRYFNLNGNGYETVNRNGMAGRICKYFCSAPNPDGMAAHVDRHLVNFPRSPLPDVSTASDFTVMLKL